MYQKFDQKLKKQVVTISPGEYYATKEGEIIMTVLGSCISVCLFDSTAGVAGMNHFMLVGDFRDEDIFINSSARYGLFAMEVLINELIKLGGNKNHFKAKVFGGGHVLNYKKSNESVPDKNIKFVRTFLNLEKIKIVSEDLGGYQGRKILFFTDAYKVLLKRLKSTVDPGLIEEEKYQRRLEKTHGSDNLDGRMTLFE